MSGSSAGALPVALEALLRDAGVTAEGLVGDPVVTGVSHDSRTVAPGDLFFCVPGANADGHRFAQAAVAAGAVALVVEHRLSGIPDRVAQVLVESVRQAMGPISASFWGHPSRRLMVIGVTGTNGKTTTATLLAHVFEATGRAAQVIGTLTGERTTPEAPDLHRRLAEAVGAGVDVVTMEVSSHALAQHRVDGTRFAATMFTNLTRDHLDFHGSMEGYFKAKVRLFDPIFAELAVIDIDGPYGRLLADTSAQRVVRVSLDALGAVEIHPNSVEFGWRGRQVRLPFGGRFNARNALLVAETALALGREVDAVVAALSSARPVPGRFEPVDVGQPFGIVVDYAHTPDGLAELLSAARESVPVGSRVIVVFGCGGDRDRSKRPVMGEIANELADVVVLTSDNPRSEDPTTILAEIRAGMSRPPELIEPDRRSAIAAAFALSQPGDLVVIAGKGHETTQTIGDRVLPFDDRAVAAELAAEGS